MLHNAPQTVQKGAYEDLLRRHLKQARAKGVPWDLWGVSLNFNNKPVGLPFRLSLSAKP